MNDQEIIQRLRDTLVPAGTSPVVRLFFQNAYFSHDFVKECIDEVEKLQIGVILGVPATALQRLAMNALLDSAYIKLKKEDKKRGNQKDKKRPAKKRKKAS